MRCVYFLLLMLGLGGWGCTEPLSPGPIDKAPAPSDTGMTRPEKQQEVQDAAASKPRPGPDLNESEPPQAALDAGSEAEAEPGAPRMAGAAADEPVADPNAGADAMPTLVGSWYGPAEDLLEREYDACFVIEQATTPGPAGTVVYTGALECTYDIEYVGFSEGAFSFNSVVKSGRGCFPSELRLPAPTGGTVRFNMYINGGSIPEGTGTLAHVTACP
jgi:hypothetical protein